MGPSPHVEPDHRGVGGGDVDRGVTVSDMDLPEDFDKSLQRQLLAMDGEEAHAYATLVSGVLEKVLNAAKASAPHEPDQPATRRAG